MGYRGLLALMFVLPSVLWASDADIPSVGLLEFLAEGSVVDGKWTDPVEVKQMSDVQKVKSAEKNSGDEVNAHE